MNKLIDVRGSTHVAFAEVLKEVQDAFVAGYRLSEESWPTMLGNQVFMNFAVPMVLTSAVEVAEIVDVLTEEPEAEEVTPDVDVPTVDTNPKRRGPKPKNNK